jgi:hypothetical protein
MKDTTFFLPKHRKMMSWDEAIACLHRALENPAENQDNQKDPEFVFPQETNQTKQRCHQEPKNGNYCWKYDYEDKPRFGKPF